MGSAVPSAALSPARLQNSRLQPEFGSPPHVVRRPPLPAAGCPAVCCQNQLQGSGAVDLWLALLLREEWRGNDPDAAAGPDPPLTSTTPPVCRCGCVQVTTTFQNRLQRAFTLPRGKRAGKKSGKKERESGVGGALGIFVVTW